MAKCMACGKTTIITTNFGRTSLCMNCGTLIKVPLWNGRIFDSAEDLINCKEEVIEKAVTNNMPKTIINEIANFFDEYINAGFVTAINGRSGQTLKVFSDYCVINTKNESKKSELESALCTFTWYEGGEDDDDEDELISTDDKKALVRGLMSGRIVQTGIGVAVSATLNKQEKEKASERKAIQKSREKHKRVDRLICVGDKRVDYSNISNIECHSRSGESNGYLRLVPRGISAKDKPYESDYFIFNNSIPFESKRIKDKIEMAKTTILAGIAKANQRAKIEAEQYEKEREEKQAVLQAEQMALQVEQVRKIVEEASQQNKIDAFEEIRKYKQLLDEDIITVEEFNSKKKELLGL